MNNRRVSFQVMFLLFEKLNINTNIFFDNYLIVILFITIQGILTFRLYRHFYYRLFAIITVILIIFTFIPFIDQVFNGFQHHKKMAFYFSFSSSILVGLFIKYFRTVSIKSYILTSLISQFVIYVSAYCYHKYLPWLILVPIVSMIGLLILLLKEKGTHSTYIHLYDFYYRVKYDGELCFIKIKFTLKTIKIAQIHFMQILVYIVLNYRALVKK